jgi:hypothetical protein
VETGSLCVAGGDVVGVESRGEGGLRDDRTMPEDEMLRGGHLGGQSGAHGTLLLQGESRGAFAVVGSSHGRLDGGNGRDQRRGSSDVGPCRGGEARRGTAAWLGNEGRVGRGPGLAM